MGKMKKCFGLFAAAFALCLAFAVSTKTEAAVRDGVAVDEGNFSVSTMISGMGTQNFAISSASLNSGNISIAVAVPQDASYAEVQLCDRNKRPIATTTAYAYAFFNGVKNNTVYTYRVRAVSRSYNYMTHQYAYTYSNWSGYRAFVKVKCKNMKAKSYGSRKQVSFKVPKIKGVKNFTITMSTKKDKGFKKVKTIKPGKKITVTKFKKKNLKRFKSYYFRVTPKLNCKIKSDLFGTITSY